MKKITILLFVVFCISSVVYAEYPSMKINDSGVRLREAPGLDGNIIRILEKDEFVMMLSYRRYGDDEFRWINVKTNTGEGWVYGEYVSLIEDAKPYQFNSIEDARFPVNNGMIEVGMTKNLLIELLGEPVRTYIDDEYKEEQLDFYYKGRLTVVVSAYNNNNKVTHFSIYTAEQELVNRTKVGMPINTILEINNNLTRSGNVYSDGLPNYFKSAEFDCSIIITTNQQGLITRIQIGGSH